MTIFLVQHGKNLSKEADPEKGLSQEGIAEVKRIAEVAKGYKVEVSQIRHSGKKRARQTAEIFASVLEPKEGVHSADGLNPLDDVVSFSESLKKEENLMLVGHLPFMDRLTSFLITGDVNKPVFRFQNGGIVCLDKNPDAESWVIKWTLMPNIR